jgi:hypothetical protein
MVGCCDHIRDFGSGFIAVDMAGEQALVFRAAGEHFLAQMLRLKRSGLNALDIAFKSGFEGCRREMTHGRVPLHFSEATGDLVRRRFGMRRERQGNREGGGEGSYLHLLFPICGQVNLRSEGSLPPGASALKVPCAFERSMTIEMASQAASARVW